MKQLAKHDRPREKLQRFGVAALGDNELVAVILGSGSRQCGALELANRILEHAGGLHALTRLAPKNCKECIDKLDKQIERDEKAVRIPGARDLLGETRVTEAIIQNRDESPMPTAAQSDEPPADAQPAKGGKGKKKAGGGKKKGKKK